MVKFTSHNLSSLLKRVSVVAILIIFYAGAWCFCRISVVDYGLISVCKKNGNDDVAS